MVQKPFPPLTAATPSRNGPLHMRIRTNPPQLLPADHFTNPQARAVSNQQECYKRMVDQRKVATPHKMQPVFRTGIFQSNLLYKRTVGVSPAAPVSASTTDRTAPAPKTVVSPSGLATTTSPQNRNQKQFVYDKSKLRLCTNTLTRQSQQKPKIFSLMQENKRLKEQIAESHEKFQNLSLKLNSYGEYLHIFSME